MKLMQTLTGVAAAIGLTSCDFKGPDNTAQNAIPDSDPTPLVLNVHGKTPAHPYALQQADLFRKHALGSLVRNKELAAGLLEVAAANTFNASLEDLGALAEAHAQEESLSAKALEELAGVIAETTNALLAYKELAPKDREPEGLTELHIALTKTGLALTQMADTLAGLGATEPGSLLAPAVLRKSVSLVVDSTLKADLVGLSARVQAVAADVRGSSNEAALSTARRMGYSVDSEGPF